ncbi:MAG: hypothetical protein M1282_05375 [Chloroflexi bacterium]|nr:hypothetical protein [Chloroflexota bacterium]
MAGPERNLKDKDIVNLLSRVKDAEAQYPSDLLSKRRARFMGAIALMGVSVRAGSGVGHTGAPATAMTLMDKVIIAIELVILGSLTAYLAATAYANRDYLKQLLFPSAPTAVQAMPTFFSIPTELTISPIPTVTGTPTPTGTFEAVPTPAIGGGGATPQPPPVKPTKPGLHLGQTKNAPGTPSEH